MAGKPNPDSAASRARAFYQQHSDLSSTQSLMEAYANTFGEIPAELYKGLRCGFQRLIEDQRLLQEAGAATIQAEHPAIEVEADEDAALPWTVENGEYNWKAGNGRLICLSVELVDELFFQYSVHGLNKSQVQILNDFGLQPWQWNSIKTRLFLQKNSNVFSPWTISITPPEKLEAMMEAKMSRRYEKQGPLIERAYANSAIKQLNKVLAEQAKKETFWEELRVELADLLPTARYRYVGRTPVGPSAPEHYVVTLADPHIGAEVDKMLNSPAYNWDVVKAYAQQMAERVNLIGAKRVYIAGLGDWIESFTGKNHSNSLLSIGRGMRGAKAIFAALEFVSFLLERINNVVELWGISGNHDRSSADSHDDAQGEAAELLFGLLRERYAATGVGFFYQYDVLVREVDGICYLLTHNHLGLSKSEKNMLETLMRHRIPGKYCIILGAHWHSRQTSMDSDSYRRYVCPPLFTGNAYSSDGGWSTLPGYMAFESVGGKYPRVVDEPLFNPQTQLA